MKSIRFLLTPEVCGRQGNSRLRVQDCQLTTDNGRLTTDGGKPICVIIRSPVGNHQWLTAAKLRIRNDELYRDTV
jgi:hypothetical protein